MNIQRTSQQELEKEILKRNPYKIDIGAVFTHKASDTVLFFPFYGRIKVHVISRLHRSLLLSTCHSSFSSFGCSKTSLPPGASKTINAQFPLPSQQVTCTLRSQEVLKCWISHDLILPVKRLVVITIISKFLAQDNDFPALVVRNPLCPREQAKR